MRTEIIYAETIDMAEDQAPWAGFFVAVEPAQALQGVLDGTPGWKFFESATDYYTFLNQE